MNRIVLALCICLLVTFPGITQETPRGTITHSAKSDTIRNNYALVAGISSYPYISRLLYADDDAHHFAGYLVDQQICDKKNITLLIDSMATKANFFKELRKLLDRSGANDRIFIYFAGHGDVENDIESGFLLTYNCEPTNYPATDAIDISMLEKFVTAFTKKETKVVLITDACRSGNLAGGMAGASSTLTSLSRGFEKVIKILSCQPNQLSQEKNYPEGGHGIFTYHLVDGLSGLADKDNDHFISLRELDRYLDEVGDETGQQQVPKTEGDPQVRIAPFSQELKLALLARKENKTMLATVTKKRGTGDSTWNQNPYFTAFIEHTRKNRLTAPEKNNAWYSITEAEKAKQPAALVQEMKLELAAILEDEAQQFINTYLRGSLALDPKAVLQQLSSARTYLQTVEKIMGENDLRYNEIHVKKLFFDAYHIFFLKEKQKYIEALDYLEKANRLLHNQAWICNAMGLLYEELKRIPEAESSYKKATQLAPRWKYPWNNLGVLNWRQGNYAAAEVAYKKALSLDSAYGYVWNGLGNVYDDTKRYPEAIEAYEKSILSNPFDDDPWNGLGNVYRSLSQNKKAEEAYRKAIAIDSVDATSWNGLGNILSDRWENGQAEEAYHLAIRFDSMYAYPWNNLGILKENTGRRAEAESFYRKAIGVDSVYSDAWSNLGTLLHKLRRHEEALVVLEKAIAIQPRNPDYRNNLGNVYLSLYQYENAAAAYKKGIAADSTHFYCWYNLGQAYEALEKYSDAAACFKKAVELEPARTTHWEQLFEVLEKIPDRQALLEWHKKKIVYFPDEEELQEQTGYLCIEFKEFSEAEKYFMRDQEKNTEAPYVYMNLAALYATWGKTEKALDNFELALKKGYAYFSVIETNTYLDTVRNEPRFIELVKKYKK